jgi:hypothetical protein
VRIDGSKISSLVDAPNLLVSAFRPEDIVVNN